MGTTGWTGRSRGNGLGYAIFIWVLRHVGLRGAYALLWFVVPFYILLSRRARRAIGIYYTHLKGIGSAREYRIHVWRHFFSFARTMVDRVAMRSGLQERFSFSFTNYSAFLSTLDRGQGLVLLSAHVGCWDAGAGFFARAGEKRLFMLQMQAERADVQLQLERVYHEAAFTVLPTGEVDGLARMMELKGILDRGGVLAFMGDRYLPHEKRMEVTFLGAEASFPVNAYHIAARMHCPVWYYFAVREKRGHYRFIFTEAPSIPRPSAVEEGVRHYVEQLERVVREYPEQWYNFYDFWGKA